MLAGPRAGAVGEQGAKRRPPCEVGVGAASGSGAAAGVGGGPQAEFLCQQGDPGPQARTAVGPEGQSPTAPSTRPGPPGAQGEGAAAPSPPEHSPPVCRSLQEGAPALHTALLGDEVLAGLGRRCLSPRVSLSRLQWHSSLPKHFHQAQLAHPHSPEGAPHSATERLVLTTRSLHLTDWETEAEGLTPLLKACGREPAPGPLEWHRSPRWVAGSPLLPQSPCPSFPVGEAGCGGFA